MLSTANFPGERQLVYWREHLDSPNAFVYAMQIPGESLFKVGWSADPFQRLATLRRKYRGLALRCVIPGSRALERSMHRRGDMCQARLHMVSRGHEWFDTRWEEGEQFLVVLEALAQHLVDTYDGSGRKPKLPSFDGTRTADETRRLHMAIERHILGGLALETFRREYDLTTSELSAELQRMRESGEYYCFFGDAEPAPRGPKSKSFVKLGHKHRYGGSLARPRGVLGG